MNGVAGKAKGDWYVVCQRELGPPVIEKAGLTEEDAKTEVERRTQAIGHHKYTVTATRTPDPRAVWG